MLTMVVSALVVVVCVGQAGGATPVGTVFTYQGRLIDADRTADGPYDFEFGLYDAAVDGNQFGDKVDVNGLDVTDGYFTAELDFGDVFDGNDRWLEIGVRTGELEDPNAYTILSPRQEITPTPYALYARKGPTYTGLAPINVDNSMRTIGLNPATNPGDLMTWDGMNWIARQPEEVHFHYELDNMQPWIGVNYCIALMGIFPSRNQEPFIGEIMIVGFTFAPRGWAFCDGQLLAISQNDALFALLGTTYGGDGRTTFALPDLRGRVPLHPGQGPGLTRRRLGEKGGIETNTISR